MRLFAALAVAFSVFMICGAVFAEGVSTSLVPGKVKILSGDAQFTATVSPSPVHSGEIALINVVAKIKPGFHIYSVVSSPSQGPTPTTITVINIHPANGSGIGNNGQDVDIVSSDPIIEDAPTVVFDQGCLARTSPISRVPPHL